MFSSLAFFLTPLGKKIGAGILVALVLAGVGLTIYRHGVDVGTQRGAAYQLQLDRQAADQERATFIETMKTLQVQVQASEARYQAAQARSNQLDSELQVILAKRRQAQEAVSKVPDQDLVKDIRVKLDVRPEDPSPLLQTDELRKADAIITDYPNMVDEIDNLKAKVDNNDQKVDALLGKVDGLDKQVKTAIGAYNVLYTHYQKAYNATQKKPSLIVRIFTLGLYKGSRMDLPDPVTLKPDVVLNPK